MKTIKFYSHAHKSVMLAEAIEALQIKPSGFYIDGTFGCGGHAQSILNKLDSLGRLLVIDLDIVAIKLALQLQAQDPRVMVVHGSFKDLKSICKQFNIKQVDGILLDLGVSSVQLDNPIKGFSFNKDGPLDMRMDQTQGITASEWLQVVTFEELVRVLQDYGQEKFAKKIAGAIVKHRQMQPILTTLELSNIIKANYPGKRKEHKHPATRTFQAIRIHINQELQALEVALVAILDLLKITGRLVVISFHSLEDSIVKTFIVKHSKLTVNHALRKLPGAYTNIQNISLKNLGKIKPTLDEVVANKRSRSAIMRVAEKCA